MNLASPEFWISLVTLTFLEIVLGIDNIIFISIAANRLAKADQKKARNYGLLLAMIFRVLLLFGISFIIKMSEPFTHIELSWLKAGISGQGIILFLGGLFLLYKSTSEIHHKLEANPQDDVVKGKKGKEKLTSVIIQICIINIVFSFDSILTAIGLTQDVVVMMLSVILSIGIMMAFAGAVGKFVNEHPSIQMLGLSFLIMIGFMLIAEGAHQCEVEIFGSHVGSIPKGFLYFAIAFSLFTEFLNIKMRKNERPVQLHGADEQAEKEGLYKDDNLGYD
ncbi:MAG: TerC family protein [Saprospiraceae bacterium]|nr:TerC family protein [Saprospiraceae bacterium]